MQKQKPKTTEKTKPLKKKLAEKEPGISAAKKAKLWARNRLPKEDTQASQPSIYFDLYQFLAQSPKNFKIYYLNSKSMSEIATSASG